MRGTKYTVAVGVVVVITAGSLLAVGASADTPEGVGQVTQTETVRPTPSVSVTRSPEIGTATSRPRVSEIASKSPEKSRQEKTRESTTPKPKTSPSAVRATPRKTETRRVEKVTTIGSYVDCSGHAQECIDAGKLTKYNPGQVTLAGHNYMGYQWLSQLPVGRTVKITSGSLAGTYKVYGHAWSERARKGGKFPAAGYSASLVLQTCLPNGTGYSLLRRV